MKNQYYLADNRVPIDELGFDTIDELLNHYDFDSQQVEIALIDENNETLESGYYNTKTTL